MKARCLAIILAVIAVTFSPASWADVETGPEILPNADFAADEDGDATPDGWHMGTGGEASMDWEDGVVHCHCPK
ncbi:MAG: hypothetical protein R6V19_03645, partial [Armatimonadota bacterium]